MTAYEAAEAYILAKGAILSPNTIKDYRGTMKNHMHSIKDRKLSTITNKNMQVWVNELSAYLSPKTVKNCYCFIASALRFQLPNVRFKVTLPMKVKHELQIPSESDVRRILSATKGTDLEVPVMLAIYCCMRRGEIAALLLHPECIGTETVTVKYSQAKKGTEWIVKAPKTVTSYRTIPCPAKLCAQAKMAPQVDAGYITDRWIKLRKKLGMNYRFHDLRHFAASSMLTVMPAVDVEKFGGWRHGSAVLQDIYTHNLDESLQRSAAAWKEKLKTLDTNGTQKNKTLEKSRVS